MRSTSTSSWSGDLFQRIVQRGEKTEMGGGGDLLDKQPTVTLLALGLGLILAN